MKKVITFGEIMMRLTTPGYTKFSQASNLTIDFAGGESNVALSLAVLQIPAAHVTRLPDNDWGDAVIENFKKRGVSTVHIIKGGSRLGSFFVEKGVSVRAGKVIYDREHSSFATLAAGEFDWEKILPGYAWFHFTGITPAISESAAVACANALKIARQLGMTVSGDIGYRSNLWKWGKKPAEVMPGLIQYCNVIICSIYDAAEMFAIYPKPGMDAFTSMAKQVMERYPTVENVIATERGQLSASHNTLQGKCYNGSSLLLSEVFDIPDIVDRIGGGDAFMAGFIYGKITFKDELKALKFGVAASVLKHTIEGDVNLAKALEIEALMNGDTSGRLKR